MGRVSRARRVATAAMYGGGGIGVLGAIATGLIVSQIRHAERTIPITETPPPSGDGRYGGRLPGEPLTLAVLGDSSAAGIGVDLPEDTPGAVLAGNLARIAGRPVRLRCLAAAGALSADLSAQVEQALPLRPDLALIMIGGNDVTHRIWPSVAVRHLGDAVRALRAIDSEVVVGTCPDLGTIQPIRPPLRWVARRWSRELAAAQTIAAVEAGGRTVSLGDLLGPEFARSPDRFFSADQFHPSRAGYAAAAAAILPAFAMTLALADETILRPARSSGVSSLPRAAVTAAYHAGTEVSGTEVAGNERGPAGRWAELRQWVLGWTRPIDPDDGGTDSRSSEPPVPAGSAISGWIPMPGWPALSRWNLAPGRRKP
ncbi:MAG: SGNH/GDSL hydrolase family protein [Micromonosporaceae bacterium]|nr:SGNH/GDSL hydrolase family protein [Micromonosporaceae bacterium]